MDLSQAIPRWIAGSSAGTPASRSTNTTRPVRVAVAGRIGSLGWPSRRFQLPSEGKHQPPSLRWSSRSERTVPAFLVESMRPSSRSRPRGAWSDGACRAGASCENSRAAAPDRLGRGTVGVICGGMTDAQRHDDGSVIIVMLQRGPAALQPLPAACAFLQGPDPVEGLLRERMQLARRGRVMERQALRP